MEARGDFHHHQPKKGHGDQQRAGMGQGESPSAEETLKQTFNFAERCWGNAIKLHVPQHSPGSVTGVGHANSLADEAIASRSAAMAAQHRIFFRP